MANSNDGNDQPEPDQNTPDQTTPQQQKQTVMGLLTAMQQQMNDDRTTMRQFMGDVTRQLANPLAPIESLWVNLRNPLDGDATQKRFINIGVNPHVEEDSDPEQYWERGFHEMSPERRRRYLAFINSRINVVPGVPSQVPEGEGTSASSRGDVAALMQTRDARIQELEEELRQALARLSSNTSAPRSNVDPTTITQMQPPAAAERVMSAGPEASRPSVPNPTARGQQAVKRSGKSKGPAVDEVTQEDPDRSGENSDEVIEVETSNKASSGTKKPTIEHQPSRSTASGSMKPGISTSPGRRHTVAGTQPTQNTELGSRGPTVGDTGERKRKNGRYGLRDLDAVKQEKATDYEIDNDPNREQFVGYTNITEDPPQHDFQAGDPDSAWKKTRKGRPAKRTGSEAADGTQNSTLVPAQNRGRAKSSPSLTTTAARPASTGASRVPGDAENHRPDDDEQPRKLQKTNVLDDIGEEPESEPDASLSSSQEGDDDGQGAPIRDRKPSNDSADGDESRNAPRARQHANRSTSQTTKGSKGQRVEKQDRRNAHSTKSPARDPQPEEDNPDNDEIHNLKMSQQSRRPSELSETDPADLLLEYFGSDHDSPNADVPDEFFDESFIDDPKFRPPNGDQDDDEEEQDLDNWQDENEAKNPEDAHRFSNRPKRIIKHNDGHRPSTGYGSRHGRSATSWVERPDNNGDNNNGNNPAKTGEKRKSNSPSPDEEDEEEEIRQSSEKKQKPNKAKPTPAPRVSKKKK